MSIKSDVSKTAVIVGLVVGVCIAAFAIWRDELEGTQDLAILFFLVLAIGLILTIRTQIGWVLAKQTSERRKIAVSTTVELHAMHTILTRFPDCSIPVSWHSMRFGNLHAILDLLDERQPSQILEFGSGISTLMIASWLREKGGGRLASVDNSESWANLTRRHLDAAGLSEFVSLHVCPLSPSKWAGGNSKSLWYNLSDIPLRETDFLIVDGPPAEVDPNLQSRLPALYALRPHLSEQATVVLDDAQREGEIAIAKKWCDDFPGVELEYRTGLSDLAIFSFVPRASCQA